MKTGIRPRGGPFIPVSEILLRASRSSGPGGQHANVTASRIEAVFDVNASLVLSPGQKARIERKVGSPVTAIAQDARSQARNRDLALERLEEKLGRGPRGAEGEAPHETFPQFREIETSHVKEGRGHSEERPPPARSTTTDVRSPGSV